MISTGPDRRPCPSGDAAPRRFWFLPFSGSSLVGMACVLSVVSLTGQPLFADEAESPPQSIFADKALEEAVRAEVFAKRNNQEPITADDVKNISRVMGRGKAIKDLSGIEHCRSLMLVDLGNNQIKDVTPLAELKRLQSVTLAGNAIKDIGPLAGLTSMQLLDLNDNQVADLAPLAAMKNLRTLYVAGNGLSELKPLAGLTKIWSLDASRNQVVDLAPIAKCSWLTTLDVSANSVTSLSPLANLKDLDLLLVEKNQISDFGTLVEMCRRDAEGERRFAPYLDVYLDGNPITPEKKSELADQLKTFGVDLKSR